MLALGVDLCGDALALALVETTGRAPRLVGSWSERLAPGAEPAAVLRAAVARHCPVAPEAVATALPGASVAHRILELPFSDPRRLAQTVPFELESLVPFDLERGVSSFTVLERRGTTAVVLAAIALRSVVGAHLEQMRSAGIDPAIVDLGALATVGLLAGPRASVLLVEPRSDGAVALLHNGRLAGLRVIDAPDEAAVLAEAQWSALALAGADALPPLVVAGADSPAAHRLASAVGVPLEALARHLPAWAAGAEASRLRAVALAGRAAGLVGLGLNFRSGELAYHAPREEARRQLRITAGLAAAVGLLAALAAGSAVAERRAELSRLDAEISRSVAAVLPGVQHGNEATQLQAAVDALEKRRDLLEGGKGSHPPVLEVLRGVASAVPERVPFQIDDCTVDGDGVKLHARTDSYESVDVLKRSLATVAVLRDPQVKDVKTGVDGRIEFRVSLGYKKDDDRD